jgi:hypothetical protein
LSKYYYKPILEKIQEAYLANANKEYNPGVDVESNVILIVNAESEDQAQQVCYGFVDVRMWQLDQTI